MISHEVKAEFVAARDKLLKQLIQMLSFTVLITVGLTLFWLASVIIRAETASDRVPLDQVKDYQAWRKRVNEELTRLEVNHSKLEHRVNVDQRPEASDRVPHDEAFPFQPTTNYTK